MLSADQICGDFLSIKYFTCPVETVLNWISTVVWVTPRIKLRKINLATGHCVDL